MRFSVNMAGLWLTAALVQFLMMRRRHSGVPLYRSVVLSSVCSGLLWFGVWACLAQVQWGAKTASDLPVTVTRALTISGVHILGALLWASFALVPAFVVAWVYLGFTSRKT